MGYRARFRRPWPAISACSCTGLGVTLGLTAIAAGRRHHAQRRGCRDARDGDHVGRVSWSSPMWSWIRNTPFIVQIVLYLLRSAQPRPEAHGIRGRGIGDDHQLRGLQHRNPAGDRGRAARPARGGHVALGIVARCRGLRLRCPAAGRLANGLPRPWSARSSSLCRNRLWSRKSPSPISPMWPT